MHDPVPRAEPHRPSSIDSDPVTAGATRRAFLGNADALMIGTHFATPTSGYLGRDGHGWRFEGTVGGRMTDAGDQTTSAGPPSSVPAVAGTGFRLRKV